MNPIIFEIGPFALHWYGVFIVGGAALAAWFSQRLGMSEPNLMRAFRAFYANAPAFRQESEAHDQ